MKTENYESSLMQVGGEPEILFALYQMGDCRLTDVMGKRGECGVDVDWSQDNRKIDVHKLINQFSEAFFAVDKDWNFTFLNKLACELLGRHCSDLIGKSIWTEFHEALGSAFDDEYHRAVEERKTVEFEEYYRPLKKWFHVRAFPGDEGLYVYFEDVSVKKVMESEIKRSHQLLSQAQVIANIGIWEWDVVNDEITWSDGAIRIGQHPQPTGSSHYFLNNFVHPEDRHLVLAAMQSALAGQPCDVEYRFLRPNGDTRVVHSQGMLLVDDGGSPVRMIGIAKDVTQRKKVEVQLRESEERYRTLVENSLNVIAVVDGIKWIYINKAGMKMFGAEHLDEITGRPVADFLHPDYRVMCKEQTRLVLVEQRLLHLTEIKWLTLQQQLVETEVIAVPLSYQGKSVVQLIIRDTSDRRQAQQLVMQSEKLSAVGQLAAGVAHEIRNPLTSLKGFLQVLRSDYEGAKLEYFDIMERELSRIELISGEMLMLAKPQAVTYEERKVQFLLQGVLALLETQAHLKSVEIVTEYYSNPLIRCVETAMKQVFVNLIKNAIEAMPHGGKLTIRIKESHQKALIQIEDEGCGIPEDILGKLGQPFITTKGEGTGLGLMVTQKIVKDHRGTIDFTSQVGVGTIVNVTIPGSEDVIKVSSAGA
ncbi:PAS domain S-box protein [Alicyclobacillus sp. SO9]|uniref:PAS domain-containing protein n=1 Tax=Alicyclobacillus sp. SO9 TaxID=2665646 RepID=UPI0018E8CDB9|nr:PAS domain S-box protein [Alicyclobacillus sp. SO9]QQE80073.1 PAS domain S-box protein [Alicyclobacillus sp. SO9]